MPTNEDIILSLEARNNASGTLSEVQRSQTELALAANKVSRAFDDQVRASVGAEAAQNAAKTTAAELARVQRDIAAGVLAGKAALDAETASLERNTRAKDAAATASIAYNRAEERTASLSISQQRSVAAVSNAQARQAALTAPQRLPTAPVLPTILPGALPEERRVATSVAARQTVQNTVAEKRGDVSTALAAETAAQTAFNDAIAVGAANSADAVAAENTLRGARRASMAAVTEYHDAVLQLASAVERERGAEEAAITATERRASATAAAAAAAAKQTIQQNALIAQQRNLLAGQQSIAEPTQATITRNMTAPQRRVAYADAAAQDSSFRLGSARIAVADTTAAREAAEKKLAATIAATGQVSIESAAATKALATADEEATAALIERNAAVKANVGALEAQTVAQEAANRAANGAKPDGFKYGYGGFTGGMSGGAGYAISRAAFGPEALVAGGVLAAGARAAESDFTLSSTITGAVSTSTVRKEDVGAIQKALPGIAASVGNHFTQQNLADAIYPVLSRGYSLPDSLRVLKQGALGAEATGIGGKQAVNPADYTTALVGAISAFHGVASDAASYNATLNTIVNKGSANVADIPTALSRFAPTANAAGADFKQSGALFASLTTNGFKTDEAAQSINAFYQAQLHTSKGEADAARTLGVERGPNAIRDAGGTAAYMKQIERATGGDPTLVRDLFNNEIAAKAVNASIGAYGPSYQAIDQQVQRSDSKTLAAGKNIVEGTDYAAVDGAINKLKDDFTTGLGGAIKKTEGPILTLIKGIYAIGDAAGMVGDAIDKKDATDISHKLNGAADTLTHVFGNLFSGGGLDFDRAKKQAGDDQTRQAKIAADVAPALQNPALITPALVKEVGSGLLQDVLRQRRAEYDKGIAAQERGNDQPQRPAVSTAPGGKDYYPPAPTYPALPQLPGLKPFTLPAAPPPPVAPPPVVESIKEQRSIKAPAVITDAPSGFTSDGARSAAAGRAAKAAEEDADARIALQHQKDNRRLALPQNIQEAQARLQIDDTLIPVNGRASDKDLARIKKDSEALINLYKQDGELSDADRAALIAQVQAHETAIVYARKQADAMKAVAAAQEGAAGAADAVAAATKTGSVTKTAAAIEAKRQADIKAEVQTNLLNNTPELIAPEAKRINAASATSQQANQDNGARQTLSDQAIAAQHQLTAAQQAGDLPAQLAALKQARDTAKADEAIADRGNKGAITRKDAAIDYQYGQDTDAAKRNDAAKAAQADVQAAQLNLAAAQKRGNLADELSAIQQEYQATLKANAAQYRDNPAGLKVANEAAGAHAADETGQARASDASYGVRAAGLDLQQAQMSGNLDAQRAAVRKELAQQLQANAGADAGKPRDLDLDNRAARLAAQQQLQAIDVQGASYGTRKAGLDATQAQLAGDIPGQRRAIQEGLAAQKQANAAADTNPRDLALDNRAADLQAQQQLQALNSQVAQTNMQAAQLGLSGAQLNHASLADIRKEAEAVQSAAVALAKAQGLTGKDLQNAKDAAGQQAKSTINASTAAQDQDKLTKLEDKVRRDQAEGRPVGEDANKVIDFLTKHRGRDDLNVSLDAIATQKISYLGIDTRRPADSFKNPQADLGFLSSSPGSTTFRAAGSSDPLQDKVQQLLDENRKLRAENTALLTRIANNTEPSKRSSGNAGSLSNHGADRRSA